MSLTAILRESGLEALPDHLISVTSAKDHYVEVLAVVAHPFEVMVRSAAEDGIRLGAASGFRSVDRQTQIWNAKFRGALAQFGDPQSSLCRVMEFSAPPGWSRHHWGCEIDIVAGELVDEARLEPEDWEEGGPCASANLWLEEHGASYGFAKPYEDFRGGFLAEPWHWSFVPASKPLMARIKRIDWRWVFRQEKFEGAQLLSAQSNRLFNDFVLSINPCLL